MNSKFLIPATIALMGISAGAWADKPEPGDQDDDGEVTMRLIHPSEAELPDAVTNRIALPELDLKNATADEKVKNVLENAEQRGTDGRKHGWDHANTARENAQDMADNANANREARGRSEQDRPEPPETPDPPEGRPERP